MLCVKIPLFQRKALEALEAKEEESKTLSLQFETLERLTNGNKALWMDGLD